MEILRLGIALLLPWALGVAWLRRWLAGSWPALLGYGYVLGILATILLVRLVDALGLPLRFAPLAGLLAGLTLLGLWWTRGVPWWGGGVLPAAWREQPRWQRWLFGLFLALIVIRLGNAAMEILVRPVYPWDAWTTWAVRPRVWFEFKQLVPFVDGSTWLADRDLTRYTIAAWDYPQTVSLIQFWMALGVGRWNESFNNLPWLLCGLALALGFYGQARLAGVNPFLSLLFTYLLLSIPMINVHIALAGYADLWMATIFGFAAMAFFQWLRTRNSSQGWLALALALACPLIKQEGAVWILSFLPAWMAARLSTRALLAITGGLSLTLIVWAVVGGFAVNLPWLGEIRLTPDVVMLPYLGRFDLAFDASWSPFVQNLFVLDNWHLVWYLAMAVMLVSLPRIVADKSLLAYAALVLAGLGMLFVLFFMTEARLWAEKYTSINRLFLHLVPALLFYLLLLVDLRPSRDSAATVPPPLPFARQG